MSCQLLALMLIFVYVNSYKLYNSVVAGSKAQQPFSLPHALKERSSRTVTPPSKPISLHVNITTVNITWEYADTVPPTQFIVQMFSQIYNDSNFHNLTHPLSVKHYVYSHMKYAVYYQFRVLAYKGGQLSNPSESSTLFDNGLTAPPGPPLDVHTIVESSSSVLLIWSGPEPANELKYIYHLYKGLSKDQLQQVDIVQENTQYSFHHLQPNIHYYFSVQADYGGERSILAAAVEGFLPYTSLPSVLIESIISNYTSVSLSWSSPNISQTIDKFIIFYTPVHPSSSTLPPANISLYMSSRDVSGAELTYTVTGLEQGVKYAFLVQYMASNIKSNLSNVGAVTTLSSLSCLSCHKLSSTQLALSWKVLNTKHVLQTFSITSMPAIGPVTFNSTGSFVNFAISGLHPWTSYSFNITLKTSYAYQLSTCPPLDCRTDEDKPTGHPEDIYAHPINSSALNISWSRVPRDQQNGNILFYLVGCPNCPFDQYPTTELYYVIGGLTPDTDYYLDLSAMNRKGFGPYSNTIIVKTMEDKPSGPPLNTTVLYVANSCAYVSWQPPNSANQNGKIILYTVSYSKRVRSNAITSKHLQMNGLIKRSVPTKFINTSLTSVNITDLSPNTTYVVRVSAWTAVGEGPESPPVVFQTDSTTTNEGCFGCSLNLTTKTTSQSRQCFTVTLQWSLYTPPPPPPHTDSVQVISYNLTFSTSGTTFFSDRLVNTNQSTYRISSDLLRPKTEYVIVLEAQLQQNQGSVQASASIKTPGCTGVTTVVAVVVSCVCIALLALLIVGVVLLIYRLRCLQKSRRHSSYSRQQMIRPRVVDNDYITLMKQQRGDGLSTNTGSSNSPLHQHSTGGDLLQDNSSDSESGNEHDPLIPSHEPTFAPPPLPPPPPSPSPPSCWSEESLIVQTDGYVANESFTNIQHSKIVPDRPVPEGSSLSSLSSECSENQ